MRCQIVDSREPYAFSIMKLVVNTLTSGSLYRPEINLLNHPSSIISSNNIPHAAGSAPDTSSCACMTNISPKIRKTVDFKKNSK